MNIYSLITIRFYSGFLFYFGSFLNSLLILLLTLCRILLYFFNNSLSSFKKHTYPVSLLQPFKYGFVFRRIILNNSIWLTTPEEILLDINMLSTQHFHILKNWVFITVKFTFFNFNITKHYNLFIHLIYVLKEFFIFY